jgi:hypothetical protein
MGQRKHPTRFTVLIWMRIAAFIVFDMDATLTVPVNITVPVPVDEVRTVAFYFYYSNYFYEFSWLQKINVINNCFSVLDCVEILFQFSHLIDPKHEILSSFRIPDYKI